MGALQFESAAMYSKQHNPKQRENRTRGTQQSEASQSTRISAKSGVRGREVRVQTGQVTRLRLNSGKQMGAGLRSVEEERADVRGCTVKKEGRLAEEGRKHTCAQSAKVAKRLSVSARRSRNRGSSADTCVSAERVLFVVLLGDGGDGVGVRDRGHGDLLALEAADGAERVMLQLRRRLDAARAVRQVAVGAIHRHRVGLDRDACMPTRERDS